jgi:HAD superfamily hydrolase (TIGR01509 family)
VLGRAPETDRLAAISDRKEHLFRQAVRGNVEPLPGVRTWLARLAAEGVSQAIATSAPPANINVMVDEAGLRVYFDAIVSGFEMSAKPDPAVFLEAADCLGVAPDRCIVVEDAIAGVEAAKRAGMRCIAVTVTNPAEALQDADIVVERLDQLPEKAFERLWAQGGCWDE